MHFTIFYAWQSDRLEKINKYFIKTAAENAIKKIRADAEIDLAPSLDHDTKGVPGIPDIPSTICEKIDRCGIFLADMTFSGITAPGNDDKQPKYLPNPNVLIELGYALAKVGPKRIIYVMNSAFGGPKELPFDIRVRRHPICYELESYSSPNRSSVHKALAGSLEEAIRTVIESGVLSNVDNPQPSEVAVKALEWRKQCGLVLWKAVLELRDGIPEVLFSLDLATEQEYPSFIKTEPIKERLRMLTEGVVARDIFRQTSDTNIEDIRPIIGEPLWQMFVSYRAFLARVCMVTAGIRKIGNGSPWYQDEPTLQLLRNAFTPRQVATILKIPLGKLGSARQCFESTMLNRIQAILPEGTVLE